MIAIHRSYNKTKELNLGSLIKYIINCKKNNGKDLKINTFNNLLFNNVIHKKSKSGFSFNNILKNNSTENKKKNLKKKIQNSGNKKNMNEIYNDYSYKCISKHII